MIAGRPHDKAKLMRARHFIANLAAYYNMTGIIYRSRVSMAMSGNEAPSPFLFRNDRVNMRV